MSDSDHQEDGREDLTPLSPSLQQDIKTTSMQHVERKVEETDDLVEFGNNTKSPENTNEESMHEKSTERGNHDEATDAQESFAVDEASRPALSEPAVKEEHAAQPLCASASSSPLSTSSDTTNKFDKLSFKVQTNVEGLLEAIEEMENGNSVLHSDSLTPLEERTLMNKINQLVKYTNMKNQDTAQFIKLLRFEATRSTLQADNRSVEDRDNICKNLTRSFTDELLLYQSAGQDFNNELKERLMKTIKSINPKAEDDFVDRSMRGDSRKSALFRDIMSLDENDLSEEKAKELKNQIVEKYAVIADLSNACSEMNKMFLDLRSTNVKNDGTDRSSPVFGTRSKHPLVIDSPPKNLTKSEEWINERLKRGSSNSAHESAHRERILSFLEKHENNGSGNSETLESEGDDEVLAQPENDQSQQSKTSSTSRRLLGHRFRRDRNHGGKSRRRRGRRWMTLFMLATVAIAALVGLVMMR